MFMESEDEEEDNMEEEEVVWIDSHITRVAPDSTFLISDRNRKAPHKNQ